MSSSELPRPVPLVVSDDLLGRLATAADELDLEEIRKLVSFARHEASQADTISRQADPGSRAEHAGLRPGPRQPPGNPAAGGLSSSHYLDTRGQFVVSTEVRGDRALVRMAGELDANVERHPRAALLLLAEHGIRYFTLDATDLTFVGASGIRIITTLLDAHPLSIVTLIGASPTYLKMLQISGVDAHLALVDRSPASVSAGRT